MEDSREAYRRGLGHGRLHSYEGPASPRDQFYGGPLRENREVFRRPSYGFTSPLGRAGNFNGPNGPVSPDRERSRGYSPERRPYSPDHDRRAYSPERPDRDRPARYQMQERTNGYRPRDEGFRRETYVYRGEDSRPPERPRDPSPDHHHSHYHGGRERADMDPHTRRASREGTPLDSWGMERGSKLPLMPSMPSHGHGSSRGGGHRGTSNSSGSMRGVGSDYPDNGFLNGDLEAGEVAPGPGPRSDLTRPSPDQHHSHHHSSHHHSSYHSHHNHHHGLAAGSGPGPGPGSGSHHGHHGPHRSSSSALLSARGGGSSGGWESKSGHLVAGQGFGPGSGQGGAQPQPQLRDGGRDAPRNSSRDNLDGRSGEVVAVRDAGARDPRDAGAREPREGKAGHRSSSHSNGILQQLPPTREGVSGRDGSLSARDRERDQERDRDRDMGGPTGSSSYAARSSSQGLPGPSPGQSPRLTGSDLVAGQGHGVSASGEVQQAPTKTSNVGREGASDEPLPQSSQPQQRWSTAGTLVVGQQQSQPLQQQTEADRHLSAGGAAVPSAGAGGLTSASAMAGAGTGADGTVATAAAAPMDVEPGLSNAAVESDQRCSTGEPTGLVVLDRKFSSSSSLGQMPALDAAGSAARISAAGARSLGPDGASLLSSEAGPPTTTAEASDAQYADRCPDPNRISPPSQAPGSASLAIAAVDGAEAGATGMPASMPSPAPVVVASKGAPLPSPAPVSTDSRPSSTAGAGSDATATATAANGIHAVASVNSLSVDADMADEAFVDACTADIVAEPSDLPFGANTQAARAPSLQPPAIPAVSQPAGQQPSGLASLTQQPASPPSPSATASAQRPKQPSSQQHQQQGSTDAQTSAPSACPAPGTSANDARVGVVAAAMSGAGGEDPTALVSPSGVQTEQAPPAYTGSIPDPTGTATGAAATAAPPTGGSAATADDGMLPEKRSSLSIRRFGFGRARRSMPVKLIGEAAPEDGELPGVASLERTPSGTARSQMLNGETGEAEAAALGGASGGVTAAGPSTVRESSYAAFPPSLAVHDPAGAPPTAAAAAIVAASSTPIVGPATTPGGGLLPTPGATAALTPGGMYYPHGGYTPQYGAAPPYLVTSPGAGAAVVLGVTAATTPMGPGAAVTTPMATRSTSSVPTGSGAAGPSAAAAGGCVPMEVDSHISASQDVLQRSQQQPGADATGSSRNPAETVAGLSLRIEHLETEITDLERQLAALASESRQTQVEAAELAAEVGALDEQLLEDSSSDDSGSEEDDGGAPGEMETGPLAAAEGKDEAAGVDRSGGSESSASGQTLVVLSAAPAPVLLSMVPEVTMAAATAATATDAGRQAQVDGDCVAEMEVDPDDGAAEMADEDGEDGAIASKLQDA
ncbi:hypothetical protein Vafri_6211, partial [Volvox africanus]